MTSDRDPAGPSRGDEGLALNEVEGAPRRIWIDGLPIPMYMWGRVMKRFQTILILSGLVFSFAVPSWAIDAKPKAGANTAAAPADTTQAGARTNRSTPANAKLLEKLKQDVRESQKSKSSQYDNYIDDNNDGIDDRVQPKARAKESESTEVLAAPQVKKAEPAKTDATPEVKRAEPPKREVAPQVKKPESPKQDAGTSTAKKKKTPR